MIDNYIFTQRNLTKKKDHLVGFRASLFLKKIFFKYCISIKNIKNNNYLRRNLDAQIN